MARRAAASVRRTGAAARTAPRLRRRVRGRDATSPDIRAHARCERRWRGARVCRRRSRGNSTSPERGPPVRPMKTAGKEAVATKRHQKDQGFVSGFRFCVLLCLFVAMVSIVSFELEPGAPFLPAAAEPNIFPHTPMKQLALLCALTSFVSSARAELIRDVEFAKP